MIDLDRLVIKPGDLVKRTESLSGVEARPFKVKEVKIVNFVQMVYPEVGPPVPAGELMIVDKEKEMTLAEKNRAALEEILNSIYGDKWDIIPKHGSNGDIAGLSRDYNLLIIHFPEVEIKNSGGKSHLIRDLYTANYLDDNYKFCSTTIYGKRTTKTMAERMSSYEHSHLSSGGRLQTLFSSFCTGSGIIDETLLLARNCNPSENAMAYEIYFESLTAFVAWESIEGGPYRRMAQINDSSGYRSVYGFDSARSGDRATLIRMKNVLQEEDFEIPITWNFSPTSINNSSSIMTIDTQELKNSIISYLKNNKELVKVFNAGELKKVFCTEIDRTQLSLDVGIDELLDALGNVKKVESSDDFVTVETKTGNLVFRGERLIEKVIKKASEGEDITNSISINNSLIKMLINDILFKFYGKLFEREDKFFEELTNGKA